MDRQTQMNRSEMPDISQPRMSDTAGHLWHDMLLLSELQLRLLRAELSEGIRQARPGFLLLATGLVLGLSSIPIVLAALALVLGEATGMTPALAFGIVGAIAVAVAMGMASGGWLHLRSRFLGVPRARHEWALNWNWIKESLRSDRQTGQHGSPIPR